MAHNVHSLVPGERLVPIVPMNVIAIMMQPAILWMEGASVNLATLEHDAKSFALKVTGARTVTEPVNAKMPIMSAIRSRDVFAGLVFQVINGHLCILIDLDTM